MDTITRVVMANATKDEDHQLFIELQECFDEDAVMRARVGVYYTTADFSAVKEVLAEVYPNRPILISQIVVEV